MYTEEFKDLVKNAYSKSEEISTDKGKFGNPYYIGFGNPNARVLIFGKEKGFDATDCEQLKYESLKNPNEWMYYIINNIPINTCKYYESRDYINAFRPYFHKSRNGHTWAKYEILLKHLFQEISGYENDFFNCAFISEVNYQPSRLSKIRRFENPERMELLRHAYFKGFPVTILGCGNYLSVKQIEDVFGVKYSSDYSQPRQKLIVFKDQFRILVQTRQLSFDVKGKYMARIADQIREYV